MVPGQPDPAFPGALPALGFIEASFANLESQEASGVDIGANLSLPIGDAVTWRSSLDASYMISFEQTKEDGTVQRYDGTLSPCGAMGMLLRNGTCCCAASGAAVMSERTPANAARCVVRIDSPRTLRRSPPDGRDALA